MKCCLTFSWNLTAQQLGLNGYIAPFSRARDRDIFYGVNYASAGAGISDETGQHLVLIQFFFSSSIWCLFLCIIIDLCSTL